MCSWVSHWVCSCWSGMVVVWHICRWCSGTQVSIPVHIWEVPHAKLLYNAGGFGLHTRRSLVIYAPAIMHNGHFGSCSECRPHEACWWWRLYRTTTTPFCSSRRSSHWPFFSIPWIFGRGKKRSDQFLQQAFYLVVPNSLTSRRRTIVSLVKKAWHECACF